MADRLFQRRSAFAAAGTPRRYGRSIGPAGVTIALLHQSAWVCAAATPAGEAQIGVVLSGRFGLAAPGPGGCSSRPGACAIWQEPGRWLLTTEALDLDLRELENDALFCDMSGGLALLRIAGPAQRGVLAKCAPLDFDDDIFRVGSAAATLMQHGDVWLWRRDADAIEMVCERSFAPHILESLIEAALEFGVEVFDSGGDRET